MDQLPKEIQEMFDAMIKKRTPEHQKRLNKSQRLKNRTRAFTIRLKLMGPSEASLRKWRVGLLFLFHTNLDGDDIMAEIMAPEHKALEDDAYIRLFLNRIRDREYW
jgi:hypothetical protein